MLRFLARSSSIKTKFLVSFLFLVLIVGVLFSMVHLFFSLEQSNIQKKLSLSTLNEAFKEYHTNQEKILKELPVQYAISNSHYVARLLKDFFYSHIGATGKEDEIIPFLTDALLTISGSPFISYSLLNTKGELLYDGFKSISTTKAEIKGYNELLNDIKTNIIKNESFSSFLSDRNLKNGNKDFFVFAQKVSGTNFILISFIDIRYYTDNLYEVYSSKMMLKINKIEYLFDRNVKAIIDKVILISILLFLLLFLFSAFISFLLSIRLSKPIVKLKDAVLSLGNGNFDTKIEEKGSSEILHVAKTFNEMTQRLKEYMRSLEDEISARKLNEAEMDIAKNIQNAVLPSFVDEFKRPEFLIASKLAAAKFIAGDFFDYFYLNEDRTKLALIIGDVSGKGVPAAFFMGILLTTIRNFGYNGLCKTPDVLLKKINEKICYNNSENMFASLVVMYYDISNGSLEYASAGHHDSFLVTNNNSEVSYCNFESNSQLIGLFHDAKYSSFNMILNEGDAVISYTDGLTDAQSKNGDFFGNSNLYASIIQNVGKVSDEELLNKIFHQVTEYQDGNLFDDMTMIMFRRTT